MTSPTLQSMDEPKTCGSGYTFFPHLVFNKPLIQIHTPKQKPG